MQAINVIDELRLILELIVAEQLFVWNFAKRKEHFWRKTILWTVFLCVLSVAYLLPRSYLGKIVPRPVMNAVAITWYISLVLLTIIQIKRLYKITWCDTLFMAIAGYAVQHVEYIVVNEVITMAIWPVLRENLWVYSLLCAGTCALWYYVIVKIFASKLKACDGLLYEDRLSTVLYFFILLCVLFISSFICQDVFEKGVLLGMKNWFQGATTDFLTCILIILVQYNVFRISTLNREKEIVQQLLYERQKQYSLSKENIAIINHKCHDLKHQIHALRQANTVEFEKYIQEVEKSIEIYDNVLKTENEVLNTILSEKSLYCEKHKIKLTCIIDTSHLDFMGTLDIYALLGNALDNAIEYVSKYEDMEKRVISLTISTKGSFLCIQMNNYFEGELTIEDGLPVTTKHRKAYHGFGMKSMRHITQKYGGTMYTEMKDGVFMLQIVIPMPKEFLRLLDEGKVSKECN